MTVLATQAGEKTADLGIGGPRMVLPNVESDSLI
jgi:hypothetical protein